METVNEYSANTLKRSVRLNFRMRIEKINAIICNGTSITPAKKTRVPWQTTPLQLSLRCDRSQIQNMAKINETHWMMTINPKRKRTRSDSDEF